MKIIGIDPGLSGAIAILQEKKVINLDRYADHVRGQKK